MNGNGWNNTPQTPRTPRNGIGGGVAATPPLTQRVAIYARVSTLDQDCGLQLAELRAYCRHRGWAIVTEFVESGVSGAKARRPELDRLMADAAARRFDAVLVWKLDRWGRSMGDLVRSLDSLKSYGVRFIAVTQGIDTDESNPMSRLLLHLLGAFSEFERELIRERVRAGVTAARARGRPHGRPRKVFRRDLAAEMRANGRSWRQIAHELGLSVTTVRRACAENPRGETS